MFCLGMLACSGERAGFCLEPGSGFGVVWGCVCVCVAVRPESLLDRMSGDFRPKLQHMGSSLT